MIEAYRFGSITIDGREYRRDVVILPDRVLDGWWRREGHLLQLEDLEEVLKEEPEVLIVGTGYSGCMVIAPEVSKHLSSKGIEVVDARTKKATEVFNRMSREKRVAAALHLTC